MHVYVYCMVVLGCPGEQSQVRGCTPVTLSLWKPEDRDYSRVTILTPGLGLLVPGSDPLGTPPSTAPATLATELQFQITWCFLQLWLLCMQVPLPRMPALLQLSVGLIFLNFMNQLKTQKKVWGMTSFHFVSKAI